MSLLHKLVSLSDDERDRLITRFWEFVTEGLDVHPGYVERLRSRRPELPEEPSTEQLEAWIELAELVQDEEFRTSVRDFYHRAFGTERGKLMTTPELLERTEAHRRLLLEARAAQQSGVAADSARARELAERAAAGSADLVAAMTGNHDPAKARRSITEFDRDGKAARWLAASAGMKLLTKYHTLVATISGTPVPEGGPEQAAALRAWLAAALR